MERRSKLRIFPCRPAYCSVWAWADFLTASSFIGPSLASHAEQLVSGDIPLLRAQHALGRASSTARFTYSQSPDLHPVAHSAAVSSVIGFKQTTRRNNANWLRRLNVVEGLVDHQSWHSPRKRNCRSGTGFTLCRLHLMGISDAIIGWILLRQGQRQGEPEGTTKGPPDDGPDFRMVRLRPTGFNGDGPALAAGRVRLQPCFGRFR